MKKVGLKISILHAEQITQKVDLLFEYNGYEDLQKVVNFIERNVEEPVRIIAFLENLGLHFMFDKGTIPQDLKFEVETYQWTEINPKQIRVGLGKAMV